uniref:Immunoglobulin domain-containing protein n=1 Tax=Cyprinus carpio TaxID=7962 RepID=A0A8C1M6W5_CYPCA
MKNTKNFESSRSVIAEGGTELKSMSVKEGDPVTLHVPQIQGDELIVWRFGDEEKLIAKADIENKSSPLYYEERFRDRLKVNDQTGSLIITNTRTTDSGLYTAKISSNKQTSYKRFTVTVNDSGYSGGAVAGIVVGVLLLAAAAAGVMYFYLRSMLAGDYVTLNPDTEIQTGDEILWLFGAEDTLIAEIKGETREMKTYKGPDEIFMILPMLDETTGSLTIEFINTVHTGLYTLKIRRGRETLYKRFIVSVQGEMITVTEGEPFFLFSGTDIQKGDEAQWLFGDKEPQTVIAEIKNTKVTKYDHWRFRDGLELDEKTGALIITNITAVHDGYYTLKITRDRGRDKIYKRFFIFVTVMEGESTVAAGDSVHLQTGLTEIQRDDEIEWRFGDENSLIAEIKGGTGETHDGPDERFRDRLELNKKTGDLIIKNSRAKHTGLYKLKISSSEGNTNRTYSVFIRGESLHLDILTQETIKSRG